ncbi:MAG: hypothetical protein OES26_10985 [Gammaproteobacteria bacterium]|nr:hypothetical protein [Gammaproteobacteria bacterium]
MRLYAGISLIAFSTLALEISLVRLLSVITWYHLAFFAISTAMLGMTAGAVTVYLKQNVFRGENLERCASLACIGYALVIPLVLIQLNLMPLGFERTGVNTMSVAAFVAATIACSLPFYFSGIAISAVLTLSDEPIGRLYAADLLGAAGGCLLVLAGLAVFDGPSFILFCAALGGLAALAFTVRRRPRLSYAGLAVFGVLAALASLNNQQVGGIRPYMVKERVISPERILIEKWNSYSRVVVDRPFMGPPQYWGASPRAPRDPIRQFWMRIDGAAGTTVRRFSTPQDVDHLRYDITNLAYYLRPRGGAGVIGVGGGRDLQSALLFGHESVVGVDVNRIFIDLLNGEFSEFAGLAHHENVTLVADEARSYLSRSSHAFSVLQMSLVDTWAATGAGAFSFTENALYTVEGWRVFLASLKDDGLFTVSRWHDPRNLGETGRAVSLAVAALISIGAADPAQHLAMLTSRNLSTLILGKQPLQATDNQKLQELSNTLGFEVAFLPDWQAVDPTLRAIVASRSLEELQDATAGKKLNYDPPTDDSPYFFNMLKLDNLNVASESSGGVLQGNLTATITLITLLVAMALLCVLTVIVPLLLRANTAMVATDLVSLWPAMLYFSLIGTGFMFTEIGLIQKLSVFLGHPVYAIGILLFTIILSTGAGSALSDYLPSSGRRVLVYPPLAAVVILVSLYVLSLIVEAMVTSPMLARILACIVVLTPMGLVMGLFFPLGMRLAKARNMPETPWLWALNGIFGVLASALAVFVAIYSRISVNFQIGALCYLLLLLPLVFISVPGSRGTAQSSQT